MYNAVQVVIDADEDEECKFECVHANVKEQKSNAAAPSDIFCEYTVQTCCVLCTEH